MIHKGRVGDINLLSLGDADNRNDHGELLGFTAIVGRHSDDRPHAIAHQHHFGGIIEKIRIRFGDIEAAKGFCP